MLRLQSDDRRRGVSPPPAPSGDDAVRAGGPHDSHRPAAEPLIRASWIPWIFAAKTTLSALLALLVAFAFNLDEPKWSLLTVFIVAQPASGLVLAKSFHRLIGSVVGAAMALLLVALFAQERVLFIGALAVWLGFCTFAAKYARNFAAYGFVLAGYTAAVVGIPGALTPGNAFYIAVARLTEIGLGIIMTATVSHLLLPVSLGARLRKAIVDLRAGLIAYGEALLGGQPADDLRMRLMGQVVATENLRASAIFEDPELRARREALERLDVAAVSVLGVGRLLEPQLDGAGSTAGSAGVAVDRAIAEAAGALGAWRSADIDAAGLAGRLLEADALLPLGEHLAQDTEAADAAVLRGIALIEALRQLFSSLAAYAAAYDAALSGTARGDHGVRFATSNDAAEALSAGFRAALAFVLTSVFWIMADWPSGVTAAILAAVATARLATMEHAGPAAIGGAIIVALATAPAFLVIEVMLPAAQGFEMFALIVGPVLFFCAFLMAQEKSPLAMLAGFLTALYFASANPLQDSMTYDAVGFINTSIAVVAAIAVAAVLFAIVAPDTPAAARRRFARAARRALAGITVSQPGTDLPAFATAMTEAFDQLRSHLRPGQADDIRTGEAAIALLAAGRGLIQLRDARELPPAGLAAVAALAAHPDRVRLASVREALQTRAAALLAELRGPALGDPAPRQAARSLAVFADVDEGLARGGALLVEAARRG